MKYPPPLLHHPSEAEGGYLDLHDEFHDADKCWLHTWNGPCPWSQSHWCWRMPTLPRHSAKREVSFTPNKGRPGWWQEPLCLWDPQWQRHYGSRICKEIELRTIRSTTEFLSEYGRRRSKCDTIMLRIWQPFSCCSTLSTASELHLWALAQNIQQYTHSDLVCSLCPGRVSHPFDILVVLKHLEELHDQPRCSDLQSTSAGSCVQIRAVMFVGYAVPENVQFSVRSSYHHILFSYGPSTLSRWVCCSSILSSWLAVHYISHLL